MTKSDDKRVPTLRFKGFTDEWEQRKLNSFLVEYKKKTKINNQYPVLTSSRQGIFFQKDYYDGNQIASKNNVGYNIVPRDYFTYRHMSDDTIFHFNINTLCDYGIVSTLYPVFTTINQLSSSWLYYYLNYGNDMKRYALLQKQGGSRTYMYFSKLKNMLAHIPSVKEQDSIAKILLKIDKLITLQQRKLNDLSSMKSALLQNIFPNTQGIKKIKLSTQEWNLQKISSIFKERNQRNKNGMLLSVSISKGVYPFSENDRKDNSSNDKSNYKEVKINDLAYNSMRMWQGAVGVSKYNGIVSPAYTVITPKKEENPNFYYYYFKNKRMLFNFRQHSQGLTSDTWNLKFPLFEKILIQVPSDKEEEQRISSLFKQLDKSIDLNKIHIEKLTSIKQFLLQNMFI